MTNSNDAFLEVLKSWLVKKLGYLADESIPVKLERNCSDIDILCMHPRKKNIRVKFLEKPLKQKLLVESKGWLDYDPLKWLKEDLDEMKGNKTIKTPRGDGEITFQFFREEIFNKGKSIFLTGDFDRVFVTRNLEGQSEKKELKKEEIKKLKNKFAKKGIILIEIHEILNDMFQYVSKVKTKNKNKDKMTEEKARLRTDLVLGIFNLIHKSKDDIHYFDKKAKC